MSLEGKLLGNRYEIIGKIGNGGMATVYKAKDKILKRFVAVKILRDEFTTDEEFIKRFEAEAQSAARLTHSNIVSIYDVGVDNNLYFIVMELIKGKTLKEIIIEEEGPLPWKWSVNVAIQIASALEVAHRNRIIHRDIKPHNIIITEDGVAKVTDFGIAKAVSNSTITAFGTTIGSVHYFSPEHARGGMTDAKSDLYSLGVVLYEMVTGKVPFDADTPVSVALKHMQENPEEPRKLNPNVPTALNKIIMKALKKESDLRYQDSTEFLEDLRECLKNPEGDFVEELEYDATAKTQVINTEELEKAGKKQQAKPKEKGLKGFIKSHKKLSIFIGCILLFALALGGTLGILNITNPPEVEMPNVVGLEKGEAQSKIEEAGLVYKVDKEEYNKDVEKDHIISQDPTYMERFHNVKKGSEVKVVVSLGTEKTKVPDLKGMTEEEVVKALEEAKLKVEFIEENSTKVEAGKVISQETEAGKEVDAGETIKVHISKGVEKSTVPSVIGMTQAEATKAIEAAGLKASVTTAEDSSKENGKVIKQSVDAGKTVDKGTTVTITVNEFEEAKTISVSINVKSIMGEYKGSEGNSGDTSSGTVNIVIKDENGKELLRTSAGRNDTNKTASITGKGATTLTLTITGEKTETRTKAVNFGTASSVDFN